MLGYEMKQVKLKENQVKLKDGNPGKDPVVIDAEFEKDGVKYVAHLIIGDQVTPDGTIYTSEALRKMMPPDGFQKIARKVGRVV